MYSWASSENQIVGPYNLYHQDQQKIETNKKIDTFFPEYRKFVDHDKINKISLESLKSSRKSPSKENNLKVIELLNDLDFNHHEISNLNKKNQDFEIIKNEMLQNLKKYEKDFQNVEKKFSARENELMDKIKIIEIEKQNIQTRLNYHLCANNYQNFSDEFFVKENRKLKEELYNKDEKLDLFLNFLVNIQNRILNKSSNISQLQSLDCLGLRSKINEIQDEINNVYDKCDKKPTTEFNEPYSRPLSLGRKFRDLSEENERMRIRIEKLNSELKSEEVKYQTQTFVDKYDYSLNKDYKYNNEAKAFSSLSSSDRLGYNKQLTFSNPKGFSNEMQNQDQNLNFHFDENLKSEQLPFISPVIKETNKTAAFSNPNYINDNELEISITKSKEDIINKTVSTISKKEIDSIKPIKENDMEKILKYLCIIEEKQNKFLEERQKEKAYNEKMEKIKKEPLTSRGKEKIKTNQKQKLNINRKSLEKSVNGGKK